MVIQIVNICLNGSQNKVTKKRKVTKQITKNKRGPRKNQVTISQMRNYTKYIKNIIENFNIKSQEINNEKIREIEALVDKLQLSYDTIRYSRSEYPKQKNEIISVEMDKQLILVQQLKDQIRREIIIQKNKKEFQKI